MPTQPQSWQEYLMSFQGQLDAQQQAISELQRFSELTQLNIEQFDEEGRASTEKLEAHSKALFFLIKTIDEQNERIDFALRAINNALNLQTSIGNAVFSLWAILPEEEQLKADAMLHELLEPQETDEEN